MIGSLKLDCKDIAKYIVSFCTEHGDPITHLKLQKLLYYCQAWYVALYNKKLFNKRFQAWVHGPVIPDVYHEFKKYGFNPIVHSDNSVKLAEGVKEHIHDVLDVLGGYSAYQLEEMTHREDPWKNARGKLPLDENSSNFISEKDMKEYYSNLA